MQDANYGNLRRQASDELENLNLVADIQVVCRFVQKQNLRLLGQGFGYQHPLSLAAGEFGYQPVFELQGVGKPHCLVSDCVVPGGERS